MDGTKDRRTCSLGQRRYDWQQQYQYAVLYHPRNREFNQEIKCQEKSQVSQGERARNVSIVGF